LIPTKFLFKILYEALPLLFLGMFVLLIFQKLNVTETEQPMFSCDDTRTLMQAYQELLTLPHLQETAKDVNTQFHEGIADLFHLGFSRNFANAVTNNV